MNVLTPTSTPFIHPGVISQATSHAFLLNCLNALCLIAIGCWYLEDFIRARRRKSPPVTETDLK